MHKKTYGHAIDIPVELVNLRLSNKAELPPFELPRINNKVHFDAEQSNGYEFDKTLYVYKRENLITGQKING